MLNLNVIFRLLIASLMWHVSLCQSQALLKVEIMEEDIFLLDVQVQQHHVGSSIDAYIVNERVLIAIEPLFDGLKLKYKIINKQLKIWKDSEEITLSLTPAPYKAQSNEIADDEPLGIWADDGYYQFVELTLLAKIFEATMKADLTTQMVIIQTEREGSYTQKKLQRIEDADGYLFPIQRIAILTEQRQNDRFNNSRNSENIEKQVITIQDQYRLFTPPHGRVTFAADLDDKQFNGSVQLVSDLLYHSSNLTMSKADGDDLEASLTLNRYKKSPDDSVLGLFDYYSIGDVSGVSNNLTTSANSGIGMVLNRSPENFRRNNLQITIEEIAPPNWDAELFHNGRFINKTEVPGDGRLQYEDVVLFYGVNLFEIKLYGPFGEEELITKTVNVKQNPLAKGQIAYSLNALDKNHNLIDYVDKDRNNDDPFAITNYGASITYGVTERWQVGATFASIDAEEQLYSLKNNLSFNNFLLENDFAINQNQDYAQLTTLTGSLFEGDNYSFLFESAENFESETVNALNNDFSQYTFSYSLPINLVYTSFGANYYKDDFSKNRTLTNILSKSIAGLSLTHALRYSDFLNLSDNSSSDTLRGGFGMSGSLPYGFHLSGQVNYEPEAEDPILNSSVLALRKTIEDPLNNRHHFQAKYYPLHSEEYRWQLTHNFAWQSDDFELTLSSGYDSNKEWDLQFGIQFFLGYDYHHNTLMMDKDISVGTATLDVNSYLDRHANGEPDVLDYKLPNVTFSGNPSWEEVKSGDDGRTILPGVSGNTPFTFSAKWQEGSATLNNDYVVYTHPGAYVDVNMPFFLITDLAGFVIREHHDEYIGLKNATMQLLNNEDEVIQTIDTDEDGYFEFTSLKPDSYKVVISQEYLTQKGQTGEIIGTHIATSGKGGFVELPAFILRRMDNDSDYDAQDYSTFVINEDNTDALVWDIDEEINKNYFSLPPKGEVTAKHSLDQPPLAEKRAPGSTHEIDTNSHVEKRIPDEAPLNKSNEKPELFTISSVLEKIEENEGTLPSLQVKPQNSNEIALTPLVAGSINATETSATTPPSIWIIQFEANKAPINKVTAIDKYSVIGALFMGQKQSSKNQVLNCIISRNFATKQEAKVALSKTGLTGWVTTNAAYSNVNQFN